MTRLILDVDTGIDDALALAYLATFDTVDVLGVIGTYGNVSFRMQVVRSFTARTDWEDSARLAIVRLRILLFQIFFRIIPVLILFFLVIIVV